MAAVFDQSLVKRITAGVIIRFLGGYDMQITILQAVLCGLCKWVFGHMYFYTLRWNLMWIGGLTGLILGDMSKGVMIAATIQPMYLAFVGAGGTIVWDSNSGTMLATAIVISGNLPLEQAIPIAVPVSLIFAQLGQIQRIWNAYPAMQADKAALEGKDRRIIFFGSWYCWLVKGLLQFVPMTLALAVGAEAMGNMIANLPMWINSALSCVGGMLPALGFAMTIRVIGRRQFLPFFIGGFFLVQYTKIGGMFLAFTGLFFAFLYYLILNATNKEEAQEGRGDAQVEASDEESSKRLLTNKDCRRMYLRWMVFAEQSNSFARLQSIAFCCAFIPALKKLYGNDPEEFSAALQRHLMFFNSEGVWGSIIHGIVLAMEEQRALGSPIDVAAITGIKAGLMGPFAGIGDTINWATFNPLVIVMFLSMGANGNILAAILPTFIVASLTAYEGYLLCSTGFRLGTRAALTVLQGKGISTFISIASVLGMFMMGGLSASFVKLVTPLYIPTSGTPALVQTGILDKIAPGILPLCVILGTYKYIMTPGKNITKATLWLTVIGLVLGAIGILGSGGLIFKAYVAPAA